MRRKKFLSSFAVCLIVFWIGRIVSINQNRPSVTYYNIGDTVDCGDIQLQFLESHIDNSSEFIKRFGVDYNNEEGDYKMVSICIEVTNQSNQDISWSEIFSFLEGGFESSVWASAVDADVTPKINIFDNASLVSGETQKIWFLTEINKACFKESSWKNVEDSQYLYVLSLVPQKTAVRLDA